MAPRPLFRIVLLLASYYAIACPLFAQQPQPGKPEDVVKVNTDLVQTDFMVFDKQGNFIDGLKNNQLILKVEGKPREITFFDRIAAGSRNEEAQLAAARGASGGAARPGKIVPLDRGRTVMFFLDDYHMSPASMSQIRTTLKRFVEREMRQNDLTAIATASGQLGFLQQLTDNKEVMATAVDRLRVQQLTLHTAEYPPMSEYQALQIELHDNDVFNFFVDAVLKENPGLPRQTAAEMVNQRAGQILEDASSITTRSLSALKSFVENTAGVAGRKVVFFVSDGFFIDRNHSDNQDRLQRITSAAARAGTVIYSLDARGLSSGLPDASMVVPADPSGRLSRANAGELRASQDGLNALASDTGGRAYFNSNSFSTSVANALKETAVYYLIAWRPDSEEQRNPKFRRIELSVMDRPELIIRFRKGFGEPASEEAKKSKDKNPVPAARKTPLEELNATLRASYPLPQLPVAISLAFLDSAQYGSTLTTSIKVDTDALATEREGETTTALLDVAGIVLNDQGRSVSSFSKHVTVKASLKGTLAVLPDYFFYNHFSLMKPGIYQVRVAAVDARRGTKGSAHQWITIPDLASKDLSMSSLIVGENRGQPESETDPANTTELQAPAALRQVLINVDHRFARSSYLRFLTFIYNAQMGATTASPQVPPAGGNINTSVARTAVPDLAVQVQIFRDNEPVVTTPLHKINTEGIDAQRVPYAADVRLNDLQPGAYVLQVTVIDRVGKSSASQKLNFQIE